MPLRTLQKPWQFRQVYRKGEKMDCKHAILFYYRTGDAAEPQFGFVASRRAGNAVQRNRAKRLMRVAAGGLQHRLVHDDVWIVLVARAALANENSQDVLQEIDRALGAAGLVDAI